MRQKLYSDLLKSIPKPENPTFNVGGKLVIVLIEYRNMEEIEYVMNAALRVYNSKEIGFAMVHGTLNEEFVKQKFGTWENVKFVNTGHDNLDRGGYSALLKMPTFWENFQEWSHALIYQTDALLIRRIDDVYFNFDYIGAPWTARNQWARFNAGNGGFSLRNIKSCIKACESQRGKNHSQIHRGNEDGYFCDQDWFKYPPLNTDLHKNFAVEKVKFKNPIGVHAIYHNWNLNNTEYDEFINYCKDAFLNNKIYTNTQVIKDYMDGVKTNFTIPKVELKSADTGVSRIEVVPNVLNVKQEIGPFTLCLDDSRRNKWHITSTYNYEILFCYKDDPSTVCKTYSIEKKHEACIHKKCPGLKYLLKDGFIYLIFYPGFPNGGEAWADIHAPTGTHFQHCSQLPKDGAIILKTRISEPDKVQIKQIPVIKKDLTIEEVKTKQEENNNWFDSIKEPILLYDLYCGVGYYNQLFSLEIAVYLAMISKRYLVLNIRHPLVACGKPNREYGCLIEYLTDKFKSNLVGFEYRLYDNCYKLINEIELPAKISNCAIVDEDLDTPDNAGDIKDFCHYRQKISSKVFAPLFDETKKVVSFQKSNASRVLYNFYTKPEKYKFMNKICKELSEYHPSISTVFEDIYQKLETKSYISVHLRFGDWHKGLPAITAINETIKKNLFGWLDENNGGNLPLMIMTDRKDNPFYEDLKKKWKIFFSDELITDQDRAKLRKQFRNTTVAEFLVQKQLCEMAEVFIGSQGSTVSVHAQYVNHLNNKPHEFYSFIKSTAFNPDTLTMNLVNPHKKWNWQRQNYMGGHPVSWTLYFEDNVYN